SLHLIILDLHSFPTRRSSDLRHVLARGRSLRYGSLRPLSRQLSGGRFCTPGEKIGRWVFTVLYTFRLGVIIAPNEISKEHDLPLDRKSIRLNSSHVSISYAVF